LLLARGPPAGRNQLEYHTSREALGSKVDLRKASAGGQQLQSGGGDWMTQNIKEALVKSHGIMMIFGWWLFIDVAVLFARYFKAMWPNTQPCNLKIWFHFHRGLNITGLILVIAAFVCVFVAEKGKWVGNASEDLRIHAICGLTCVIGGLIQPIMALFRCKPDGKYRPIFNWIHRFLGVSSWCLASVTIWWATNFRSVGIYNGYDHGTTPRALMILLWAGLGATLIALEVHLTATERIGVSDRVGPGRDLAMERLDGASPSQRWKRKAVYNKSWPIVRCAILGLFVCLAIAITVTLAYWIGIRSQ